MSRVLLVSPTFHGYWASIADALGRRGHTVRVHRYDHRQGMPAKLRHKLLHELPHRAGLPSAGLLGTATTRGAVEAVQDTAPDVVVVVKGDLLGEDFWDLLAARAIPRVTWLYDELRRTRHTPASLERVGPIASYSALDAASLRGHGLPAEHLPLAFDTRFRAVPPQAGSRVVFVGARYPRREEQLAALAAAGVEVRAYGRDWSSHPVDRIRTWRVGRPAVAGGRDLPREQAYAVMAGAPATLNIHGDQDGFTMRTFEACGVGALQVIDRADVADLYEPGVEIAPYASTEELIELCRRARADRAWATRLRAAGRRRTLAEHTFDHRVAVLERLWQEAR